MPINYRKESETFRPRKIKTLLVAEAPPSSGKKYFYVPRRMSRKPIRKDSSLAATVFNHYGLKKAKTEKTYRKNLLKLKRKGVFLIDIMNKPLRIRGNKSNEEKLVKQIPRLRRNMKRRKIRIKDKNITFLLARKSYKKYIKKRFPESEAITWKKFRLSKE